MMGKAFGSRVQAHQLRVQLAEEETAAAVLHDRNRLLVFGQPRGLRHAFRHKVAVDPEHLGELIFLVLVV